MSLPNLLQFWESLHLVRILTQLKQENIELNQENIPLIVKRTSFKVRSKEYES